MSVLTSIRGWPGRRIAVLWAAGLALEVLLFIGFVVFFTEPARAKEDPQLFGKWSEDWHSQPTARINLDSLARSLPELSADLGDSVHIVDSIRIRLAALIAARRQESTASLEMPADSLLLALTTPKERQEALQTLTAPLLQGLDEASRRVGMLFIALVALFLPIPLALLGLTAVWLYLRTQPEERPPSSTGA